MDSIQLIIALEKKLDIPFKQVDNIDYVKLSWEKKAEYSIDANGRINALSIRNFDLKEIPNDIVELNNLKTLILQRNKIVDISILKQFKYIQYLDLSNNLVENIDPLEELENLVLVDLSYNRINDISPLKKLKRIQELDLRNNEIIDISPIKEINYYNKTEVIFFPGNRIVDISILTEFKNITDLNLDNNKIKDIAPLKSLTKLETLYLDNNQIEDITPLQNLKCLNKLSLKNNPIKTIPSWLTSFNMEINWENSLVRKDGITLFQNPIESPPLEIVQQGKSALLNYFEQIEKAKEKYLFETKLLILGEGGTGKTSLARKLKDVNSSLPREDESTMGIEVSKWSFYINHQELGDQTMFVNLWDFGGQRLYHGIHQIFFSPKSFYILLYDTREEKTDFSYWLNSIEQAGGNQNKLLIVVNKKHDHIPQIDQDSLKKRFGDIIIGFFVVDLKKEISQINRLQSDIKHHLLNLEKIGDPLPSTWVNVYKELYDIREDCISFENYIKICLKHGIEFDKLNYLSEYFNRIGVITHFYEDNLLRNRVYLNSNTLLKRIYEVLNHEIVSKKQGKITGTDLQIIWKLDYELLVEIDYLKNLMSRFGLMYQIPHTDEFVIPAHLPISQPYMEWEYEHEANILQFIYKFDKFMPHGIMTRLIVVLNKYIVDHNFVWSKGAKLKFNHTFAEIKEIHDLSKIQIRIVGTQKKDFLSIISYELEELLSSFNKLSYEKMIPCICNKCKINKEPFFYEYSHLLKSGYFGDTDPHFGDIDPLRF